MSRGRWVFWEAGEREGDDPSSTELEEEGDEEERGDDELLLLDPMLLLSSISTSRRRRRRKKKDKAFQNPNQTGSLKKKRLIDLVYSLDLVPLFSSSSRVSSC